ncbi:MAG: hypothetical protein AAFY20_13370 [Cyanobacteria bacterium J06639_14]
MSAASGISVNDCLTLMQELGVPLARRAIALVCVGQSFKRAVGVAEKLAHLDDHSFQAVLNTLQHESERVPAQCLKCNYYSFRDELKCAVNPCGPPEDEGCPDFQLRG